MGHLEDDIDTLAELDRLRIQSAALRDEGRNALWHQDKSNLKEWAPPNGVIEEALIMKALAYRDADDLSEEQTQQLEEITARLENLTAEDVLLLEAPDKMPVLRAARAMQALVAAPDSAFSEATMYFYYLIVREICTADAPDWSLGGARAGQGGSATAFMTGECVRAISGFARTLDRTALFIEEIRKIRERGAFKTLCTVPPEWCVADVERIQIHFYPTLKELSSNIALSIEPALSKLRLDSIGEFLDNIDERLAKAIWDAGRAFRKAHDHLEELRDKEERGRRFDRSESGHAIALSAIEQALCAAELAYEQFQGESDRIEALRKLEVRFRDVAHQVRKLLHPAKGFISSVLDRELAAASAEGSLGWDPAEMAFAAASYGAVAGAWSDDRLLRAGTFLARLLSERGRFPAGRPIFVVDRGYKLHVIGGEVLRALAQLIERVPGIEVTPQFVRGMMTYFEDTRLPGSDPRRGWCHEEPPQPARSCRWATAIAVLALDRINRMLDERINLLVFKHFSVKHPQDLAPEIHLSSLFYSDYGLRKAPEKQAGIPLRRSESVAILLERMRAHVLGIAGLKAHWEPLYSIVLHGPAGTGKTSLIEALALTCGVPLVEVTPSDIVVGGADAIERRTRAVFKALSLLTRSVILFDEFDPVLKRRDPAGTGPSSVFSFLTPGMLPKLKTLSQTAKRRRVAYALITNLIGTLDEASVRSGRFDAKVGIFPPDPLSRAGRLWSEILTFDPSLSADCDRLAQVTERIRIVLNETGGAPMQILGRPGWFTRPKNGDSLTPGTPFHFIFEGTREPDWPVAEENLTFLKGEGTAAKQEFMQWSWIDKWDERLRSSSNLTLEEVLATPPENAHKPRRQHLPPTRISIVGSHRAEGGQGWEEHGEAANLESIGTGSAPPLL